MKKSLSKAIILTMLTCAVSTSVIICNTLVNADNLNNIILSDNPQDLYANCVHGKCDADVANYIEPNLPVGNYYLDGDTTKQFYQVNSDNTIQLMNADYDQIVSAGFPEDFRNPQNYSTEDFNFYQQQYQNLLDYYSSSHTYKIVTEHKTGDDIMVYLKWTEDETGHMTSGTGLKYILPNQLTDGTNIYTYIQ